MSFTDEKTVTYMGRALWLRNLMFLFLPLTCLSMVGDPSQAPPNFMRLIFIAIVLIVVMAVFMHVLCLHIMAGKLSENERNFLDHMVFAEILGFIHLENLIKDHAWKFYRAGSAD